MTLPTDTKRVRARRFHVPGARAMRGKAYSHAYSPVITPFSGAREEECAIPTRKPIQIF